MRCGTVDPRNTFTDHEAAVDLRCGTANTKTPNFFARLDPVFARDNSGLSVLFFIKKESTRLATSSSFSKRHNGKEPPRVKTLLPLPRAPLQKTPTGSTHPASSFNTLTHVVQATSAPVAQEEDPTLRDGPFVTPRPPARSAGRYSRKFTEESRLSSSRNSSEPLPLRAQLEQFSGEYTPKSEEATTRETVGSASHRAPEACCS